MNARLYYVTKPQVQELTNGWPDQADILDFCQFANPLLAGVYGGRLLCFIGLVPRSPISATAYIWMRVTSDVSNHKLVFAKLARRSLEQFYELYTTLEGHCMDQSSSIAWLRSLGATFATPIGGLIPFTLKALNG